MQRNHRAKRPAPDAAVPARRRAGADRDIVQLLVILGIALLLSGIFIPNLFYTKANLTSMAFQFPEFGLMAMGMALAMLTGGSDLSVVNTGNLTAIVTGKLILGLLPQGASEGMTALVIACSILAGLALGWLLGAFNGFLIARVGIPPILTTLGTMQLYGGLGIVITKGSALYGFPPLLSKIGNGSAFGVIPYPLIIFAAWVVVVAFIIQKSAFGMRLYLMGSNPVASSFSGINNSSMLIRTYALSGMLAAMAGIVILARNNSASADYGSAYILQTILVAIMAGFSPSGGKGRITGLVLAVITLQVFSSALNMTNITSFFKQLVYGGMLLMLVIFNNTVHWTKWRGRGRSGA